MHRARLPFLWVGQKGNTKYLWQRRAHQSLSTCGNAVCAINCCWGRRRYNLFVDLLGNHILNIVFSLLWGTYPVHCFLFDFLGAHILHLVFVSSNLFGPISAHCFFVLGFLGVYRPWELSHFVVVDFHVECISNHVWGPPGAWDMTIFVQTCIFTEIIWVISVEHDLFSG